jgi:hypothetical protein
MKVMKTVILFLVFIALGAYVYFYEIEGGKEREKIKELEEKVFNFESDSISAVKIDGLKGSFSFFRTDDGWQIERPVKTDGDKSSINSLLTTLANLKKDREFSINRSDLANFGLTGQVLEVRLTDNQGKKDLLRYGDETGIESKIFVTKTDTVVYTVPAYSKNSVDKSLFDWRDKSVVKVSRNDIRELHLKNRSGSFQFVKEGSDWYLKIPIEAKADNSNISTMLSKLETGKAKSVVSETLDTPAIYHLNKPAYVIDIFVGEGKAHQQVIFSALKDNSAYGKDEGRPQVFTVDSVFLQAFDKSLMELRNKKFAEFNKDDANKIEAWQGDSLITLVKDSSDSWFMQDTVKLKSWKMNSYLNSLTGLTAKKYIAEKVSDSKQHGLAKPQRRISVYSNGDRIAEIVFGEANEDRVTVFSRHTQTIAEIDKSDYDTIEIKVDAFKE